MFSRLKSRVPERFRWLIAVASVAFVIFELSRFAAVAPFLEPFWRGISAQYAVMASKAPMVVFVSLSVTALAFVIPMAGVIWALRWLHRRLFHSGTIG